ncbi:MAG TPA: acetyl-CoA carboxylase biotin carboxyl carrier protein [Thermomicrobiales bacterium]|nr:acetyl-CoA carboxylase biotin carboxyl carrier protein [Thermomicrobiales bacterium]
MERFAGNSVEGTPMSAASDTLIGTVRELISMMGKGGISELDLSTGDLSIRLRGQSTTMMMAPPAGGPGSGPPAIVEDTGHTVTAPMIGTYYSSPSPGEAPFVHVGDDVEVGQVVGIIEAMKIMNEIISDRAGPVLEVMVENAQPVEYGSPLLRLGDPTDNLA